MHFIIDFFRQKTPKAGREMPGYYRQALIATEVLLAVYFLLCFFLFPLRVQSWERMPMFMFAGVMLCLASVGKVNIHYSIGAYALVTCAWCWWYIHTCGWSVGGQHFLVPLLTLLFFNIYNPPWLKAAGFVVLVSFRMLLYAWTLHNAPVYALSRETSILFQTINSLMFFAMISSLFILFSTSMQDTERKLRLDNQELHKEAGTDPLTQLPNRRAMLDFIDNYTRSEPEGRFSVAIADIDFFKKVNDTYGHNCGDYTLRELSALFKEKAGLSFQVCRWGGEEFCFFLPDKNLDEAGAVMFDVGDAVRKMPLHFGDVDFSITVTIGVEENDYHSPIADILERADQKLYRGKLSGRNQVVI